jgi:proline racemase
MWRQESAIGSLFCASYVVSDETTNAASGDDAAERTVELRPRAGSVIPSIAGRAFVVAEGRIVADHGDPSRRGGWIEEA